MTVAVTGMHCLGRMQRGSGWRSRAPWPELHSVAAPSLRQRGTKHRALEGDSAVNQPVALDQASLNTRTCVTHTLRIF